MTAIREQCIYLCGPYKGYSGRAEYDRESDVFHGEVGGTRDVVTFQGRTPAELGKAFQESVDDYLEFCASRGEEPEKPFSGKFMARIDPEVHRKISMIAEQAGISLNQFICDCLKSIAEESAESPPCAEPTRQPAARRRKRRPAGGSKKPAKRRASRRKQIA